MDIIAVPPMKGTDLAEIRQKSLLQILPETDDILVANEPIPAQVRKACLLAMSSTFRLKDIAAVAVLAGAPRDLNGQPFAIHVAASLISRAEEAGRVFKTEGCWLPPAV